MSVPPPEDKRAAALRLLAERARRVSLIRQRIVVGAIAAFVMAWSVIAWTGPMGTTTTTTAHANDEPSALTTQQS